MGKDWECIVLPTGIVFLKQRVGYRVRQGFISGLFQKQCEGGYRSWYTYSSNLVAIRRLLRTASNKKSWQVLGMRLVYSSVASCMCNLQHFTLHRLQKLENLAKKSVRAKLISDVWEFKLNSKYHTPRMYDHPFLNDFLPHLVHPVTEKL